MRTIYTFDQFTFDAQTGELTRADETQVPEVGRLSPQAAKLLHALLEKYPEHISKEEIKTLLWSEVEVDFDNSLHFCIRQIRRALQDNANDPKYIETIPRRGYRWLVPIVQQPQKKPLIRVWFLIAALVTLGALSALFLLSEETPEKKSVKRSNAPFKKPIRLLIMPMQPVDTANAFFENTIAYDLLARLGNNKELNVIGPTTTQHVSNEDTYRYLEDSGADYMINGKLSGTGAESHLLVEIIRGSDKAHVWVTRYDKGITADSIVSEIYHAFLKQTY